MTTKTRKSYEVWISTEEGGEEMEYNESWDSEFDANDAARRWRRSGYEAEVRTVVLTWDENGNEWKVDEF